MATSTISHAVGAANSKMAQAIRDQEERELRARSRGGRDTSKKQDDKQSGGKGKNSKLPKIKLDRWKEPAAFSQPTPIANRPRNDAGASSFHFAVTKITKEGSPTYGSTPLRGYETAAAKAANHEAYVSREDAPELVAAAHAVYVERQNAPELSPGAFAESSPDGASINEMNENVDGQISVDARGVPSIFSNISADPNERIEFWKAVHNSEFNAKIHTLVIDARKDPAWVKHASEHPEFPAALRETFALALADLEAYETGISQTYRPRSYPGTAEATGALLIEAGRMNPAQPYSPSFQFKSGKGGTVQHRFVLELPHELNAAERAALAKRFCEHLGAIDSDADGRPRGMMYTGVVHAPDAHNDTRNFHLHVIAHDRPAKFMQEFGMWDFEVAATKVHRGEIRTSYPYRQNKIEMVRQNEKRTQKNSGGKDFIPALRRTYADMANEAMALAGIDKRYDPRSYKAMGIERTPTQHLGTKAAALEAAGIPTTVGTLNAQIIWSDAERQAESKAAKRKKAQAKTQELLIARSAQWRSSYENRQQFLEFEKLTAEHGRLVADIADDAFQIERFDLGETKARSRAEKVRQTAIQTLVDIDNGVAPAKEVRARRFIQERFSNANEWLRTLDNALETDRPAIDAARKDIRLREERLVSVEARLNDLWQIYGPTAAPDKTFAKPRPRTLVGDDDFVLDASGKLIPFSELPPEPITIPEPRIVAPAVNQDVARSADPAPSPVTATEPSRQAARPSVIDPFPVAVPPLEPVAPPPLEPVVAAPPTTIQSADPISKPPVSRALEQSSDTNTDRPSERVAEPTAPDLAVSNLAVSKPVVGQDVPDIAKPNTPPEISVQPLAQVQPPSPSKEQATRPVDLAERPGVPAQAIPPVAPSKRPDLSTQTTTQDKPPVQTTPIDTPVREVSPVAPAIEPPPPKSKPPVRQPTMFDLPKQGKPIKEGTHAALLEKWEAVFQRIEKSQLLVLISKDNNTRLEVPDLTDDERAILRSPDFIKRTVGRLTAIKKNQDLTVGRLTKWLDENMNDPEKIIVRDRNVQMIDTPKAISTFLKVYKAHPDIKATLERGALENADIERFVQWIQTKGRDPQVLVLRDGVGTINSNDPNLQEYKKRYIRTPPVRRALRAEYNRRTAEIDALREKLRDPSALGLNAPRFINIPIDRIKNETLQDFVIALNVGTQDQGELARLAKRIERDPAASAEVYAHGEGLAVAFVKASNQRPVTHQTRSRDNERDF